LPAVGWLPPPANARPHTALASLGRRRPWPPLPLLPPPGPPAFAPLTARTLPRAHKTLKRPHGLARKCQCFS
jgi:hypothetical protein